MLLQLGVVMGFVLGLLGMLMFIWPRRDALRRRFGGSAGGVVGSDAAAGGYLPHCDHSGDGGGGND